MRRLLPQTFSFSWKITLTCLFLAAVMFRLSYWQWQRYLWKVDLVKSYDALPSVPALPFPSSGSLPEDFDSVVNRRVSLRGRYDYEHQVIVTNKRHASDGRPGTEGFATEPGHFLFAPFIIDGSNRAVFVSRGFIPFEDLTPETWKRYDFQPGEESLSGVVKRTITPWLIGPRNPKTGGNNPFQTKFKFEEISKLAAQLPYPSIEPIYIQRLGNPPVGNFPAEAVSIEVPPSTHHGYMLEWASLGILTLAVGFILQAFPWYRGYRRSLWFQDGADLGTSPNVRVLH